MIHKYLLLVVLLFGISCNTKNPDETGSNQDESEQDYRAGTVAMIDSISNLIDKVDFRNHLYESGEKLKRIEVEVEQARANKSLSPRLYIEYGTALLNAGKSEEAIAVFEDILNKMPENRQVNQITKGLHEAWAISYMRLGEQINCRDNHSTESCLFPIKGGGIHQDPMGSRRAISIFQNILKVFPDDLQIRWLLNVAYMTLGEYPEKVPPKFLISPAAFETDYSMPEFPNISMYTGMDVNDLAGGVIMDDFNNDNYLDVMVTSWGMFGSIQYFENNGDGTFENRTNQAGLNGLVGGLHLTQADFNNDGHLDFYVIRGAWRGLKSMGQLPNSLLKNNGDGTFSDVTVSSGLYGVHPTQSVSWFDANSDGWLDLFVGNETHTAQELHPTELFMNQKDGTFKNEARASGLELQVYVKGTTVGDINNDGLADLYVSVLNGANKLFINQGANESGIPRFQEISEQAKVTEPLESFPTWFFDYNNDGLEDLFVNCYDTFLLDQSAQEVAADYLGLKSNSGYPRLYKNLGNGEFENVTLSSGMDKIIPTMGCNFGDLDNDGFLDMYLGTGAPDFRSLVPNRMFRNDQGNSFQEVTSAGNFGHLQKGHGVSFADIDNDGDQDIYAVMGGAFSGDAFQNALFENPGNDNSAVILKLEGTSANKSAIGARIKLTVSDAQGMSRVIYHTVSAGSSFGANSLRAEIGLGHAQTVELIEISWPNGRMDYQQYGALTPEPGYIYKVVEGSDAIETVVARPFKIQRMKGHMNH